MLLGAERTADQRSEPPERLGRQPHPSGRESLRREHDLRRSWVRKGIGWGRRRGFIEHQLRSGCFRIGDQLEVWRKTIPRQIGLADRPGRHEMDFVDPLGLSQIDLEPGRAIDDFV